MTNFLLLTDAEHPLTGYTNWEIYEPADNMDRECIKIEKPFWKWENADCEERNYFVCLAGNPYDWVFSDTHHSFFNPLFDAEEEF